MPLHDQDGNIIGIMGTSLDITQRKKLEEELKIAKEKAEAASKAKTEFIAHMSHDVKTPLSGIISLSESLSSRIPEEYRHITKDILEASEHLMVFFKNCIELVKLENGSIFLSKEKFGLKPLLDEVLCLFQPVIKSKALTLHVEYDEKIPKQLLGSRITLYRVLLNLLGNAVKFTSKGSISIRAKLKKATPSQATIKLSIADTGIGIPSDKQKIIFEYFTRLTKSYEGTYEGSGIGLYIVEKFVKSMGGKIQVNSEEGKGSEFTVVVPLEIPPLSASENDADDFLPLTTSQIKTAPPREREYKLPSTTLKPDQSPKPKILLVEDNTIAQKTTSLLLDALGCEVDLADCGAQAITLFAPGKYALVFMDIGLPDMNGYQVTEQLRKMEQGTEFHAPILGLSAHVAQEEEEQLSASAAGIDEMYSKPLRQSQAIALLRQYAISGNTPSDQQGENSSLPAATGRLKIIDMNTILNYSSEEIQFAFKLLDLLIASLPEFRAEIEQAYKAQDTELLISKLLKFRGGVCYTNTPSLLNAAHTLEMSLREGNYDQTDRFYQDLLEALNAFEGIYRSLW